jgi:O-succinylbenzoic acid--CoA ligase
MINWNQHAALPALRTETHFNGRQMLCFSERPASFYALFAQAVTNYPDAEAIACDGQRWTYRAANEEVARIAAGFTAHGIQCGQRVVLFITNKPEFVFVLFALQKIGAIAVPVGTREQAPGLAYVIGQCGAAGIVFDSELADRIPAADVIGLRIHVGAPVAQTISLASLDGTPATATVVQEEDCAAILYTSGTTGNPKGAMLTHLNIAHSVIHYQTCLQLTQHDRAALAVPASHVTGLIALIAAIIHVGGTLVIVPEFKAATFVQLAASERISFSLMVPAMYQLCLLQPAFAELDLSAWRIGAFGGAPMPAATIATLAAVLPQLTLVNCYGSTETTSPATIMPLGLSALHPDSVGITVPCGSIAVVDENGQPVAAGESGELWIGGAMVVPGYWDNTEASAKGFDNGCWRSGDIGSVDAHGLVRIFDRIKDMINRGGFKIYSVEVENTLMGLEGVVEAAVVGQPCPVLGERVHAYVYAPQVPLDAAQVRAYCTVRLADYKVPEEVFFVDKPLPRNANGKLLKRQLRG